MKMDFEKTIAKIEERNKKILNSFNTELINQKLSGKTIKKHMENIEFYINEYLSYRNLCTPEDGIYEVSEFLGYFFIRKCMWSSASKINEYITSFKKFYLHLCELDLVSKEQYIEMVYIIKVSKDDWINEYYEYYEEEYDFFRKNI